MMQRRNNVIFRISGTEGGRWTFEQKYQFATKVRYRVFIIPAHGS